MSKDNPTVLEKLVTKVAVLEARLDVAINDIKDLRQELSGVHDRINNLVQNELKHYRGMSNKEKAVVITVPTLISLIGLVVTLIQAIG